MVVNGGTQDISQLAPTILEVIEGPHYRFANCDFVINHNYSADYFGWEMFCCKFGEFFATFAI